MGWHLSCVVFGENLKWVGIILFLYNKVSNIYGENLYIACHILK